jgi:hypothetical protein
MASMGDMEENIQLLVITEGGRQLGDINIIWKKISTATSVSQDSYGNASCWFQNSHGIFWFACHN